jgi:hypothetical protein
MMDLRFVVISTVTGEPIAVFASRPEALQWARARLGRGGFRLRELAVQPVAVGADGSTLVA